MIEFYRERAPVIIEWEGFIESSVTNSKVIKAAKRSPCEVTEFGMIAFTFQLTDHSNRDDDLVFCEAIDRTGVCEEHTGIKYIRDTRCSYCRLLRDVLVPIRDRLITRRR